MRLASRFGLYNSFRRERSLTDDELMQFVPSIFSGDKHESRSERYTYIPTINIINKLRDEGFQPFVACQSQARDLGATNTVNICYVLVEKEVPEIILLKYTFHIKVRLLRERMKVQCFDKDSENMEMIKEIHLKSDEQHLFGRAVLMARHEDKTPVTPEQIITHRRREDKQNDLWTAWQRVQENMIKGGLSGRSASGKNTRTRAITGIDGDIRINKALWVIAEQFRKWKS